MLGSMRKPLSSSHTSSGGHSKKPALVAGHVRNEGLDGSTVTRVQTVELCGQQEVTSDTTHKLRRTKVFEKIEDGPPNRG